jgi:REP element-mobilizing transposase RayT
MKQPPLLLDDSARAVVHAAIREACAHRGWDVSALNVRTNHVHAVITTVATGHEVINALKARATRVLREQGIGGSNRAVWARGGSARRLLREEAYSAAVDYVLNRQ